MVAMMLMMLKGDHNGISQTHQYILTIWWSSKDALCTHKFENNCLVLGFFINAGRSNLSISPTGFNFYMMCQVPPLTIYIRLNQTNAEKSTAHEMSDHDDKLNAYNNMDFHLIYEYAYM